MLFRSIHSASLMAGVEGVEPSLTEPESAVLPLDDTPVQRAHRALGALQTQVEILQKSPDVGKCELQNDRSRTTNGEGPPEAPCSPSPACPPSPQGESPCGTGHRLARRINLTSTPTGAKIHSCTRPYLSWIEGLTTNQNAGGSNPSCRTIVNEKGALVAPFFVA